jgi:hypothetical protein
MTKKRTSPAPKTFRVYAADLLFQDVEAATAKDAYAIAAEEQLFEPCGGFLTLDPVVKDLDADEDIRVGGGTSHCKSCGSDMVMMMNDSNFQGGECGPCEYERYQTQPALLVAAKEALMILSEIQCDLEDDKGEAHCIALLESAIQAYGHAA